MVFTLGNLFLKMGENMIKQISFKRLEEILGTLNPNVVKEVSIELSSSCSSDMPFWADIKVGYWTYRLMLGDIDDRYWVDGIQYFFDIIRKSGIKYSCNEYKQQTCNGYKVWSI